MERNKKSSFASAWRADIKLREEQNIYCHKEAWEIYTNAEAYILDKYPCVSRHQRGKLIEQYITTLLGI